LADELNSLLPEYDTVLRDRTQLVREIDGLRVSKDAWLLTFDVESLYPNVDHAGCVAACAAAVHGSGMRRAMVAELLEFVLKNNVVTVQGKYYRQIFGGAMGTTACHQQHNPTWPGSGKALPSNVWATTSLLCTSVL
jgi:hypothetical protein